MEVLGFKSQRIERLNLQGNFRERLESPRIFERAKSIERLGILSEPMVRQRDMRVIYGHDRIAGAIRAGRTEVLCKMVECTDEELHEIEITENVQRRHDAVNADKNLHKLLNLYELQVEETPPDKAPLLTDRGESGRAKTARGIARVRASAELGIKAESVRRREQRAKAREDHKRKKAERDQNLTPAPTINMLGMEVNESFIADTVSVHQLLQRVKIHLESAQAALKAAQRTGAPMPAARHQKVYDEIHQVSALVRAQLPVSLCPYCKGLPGLQENCTACIGCGWLSAGQASGVPKELWQEGDQSYVLYRGALTPVRRVLKELGHFEPPAADVIDAEELFA